MPVVSGNEIRVGMKIEMDGAPFVVVKSQHVKMANRRAIVQAIIKNLLTGQVLDRTFHERDKFSEPDLIVRKMTFLYRQGDEFVFMDSETYDQPHFSREMLGDAVSFLKDNTEVDVLFYNDRPVSVELPFFMVLAITHTEPGARGDTATNVTKPATLETGAIVKVPLFINEGDTVKVDTRSGEYLERAQIA